MRAIGGCFAGFGQYGFGPMMMGGGFLMMLGTLLLIGLILYLLFRKNGVSCCNGHHGEATISSSAMTILEERYAKGEIDTEEFQKRKAELERK